MKIAVFGGAGFLGSYLVDALVAEGHEVHSIDLKDSTNESARSHQVDILNREALHSLFEKNRFQIVYNLAGFAKLDDAIENPIRAIELNVIGNMHILELSIEFGVQHFLYASSAYAVSTKGSFYGISKLSSEKIIKEYGTKHELNYTILRYGSVYSDKEFENNYIYHLVKQAFHDKKIVHAGDGEETREYIHAFDAAKLSVQVLNKPEYFGKHLILTGSQRLKRKELFQMVREISNTEIDITLKNDGYVNHYRHTPYAFVPDVSERLTPNPFIDMGQGIISCFLDVARNSENED